MLLPQINALIQFFQKNTIFIYDYMCVCMFVSVWSLEKNERIMNDD